MTTQQSRERLQTSGVCRSPKSSISLLRAHARAGRAWKAGRGLGTALLVHSKGALDYWGCSIYGHLLHIPTKSKLNSYSDATARKKILLPSSIMMVCISIAALYIILMSHSPDVATKCWFSVYIGIASSRDRVGRLFMRDGVQWTCNTQPNWPMKPISLYS